MTLKVWCYRQGLHHSVYCPEGAYFPDRKDCRVFHQCAHGRPVAKYCGPGTVYNPHTRVCDWPHNVHCPVRETTSPMYFCTSIPNSLSKPSTILKSRLVSTIYLYVHLFQGPWMKYSPSTWVYVWSTPHTE